MNDKEILAAMLKKADAEFDVCDNNITIYGYRDDIVIFYFDEAGNVINVY